MLHFEAVKSSLTSDICYCWDENALFRTHVQPQLRNPIAFKLLLLKSECPSLLLVFAEAKSSQHLNASGLTFPSGVGKCERDGGIR